jgi:hypothetical protein
MLILKDINGKLPLRPFLNKFILDNPNVSVNYNGNETYLSDIVTEKLLEELTKNEFEDVPKHLRHKNSLVNCSCWSQYKNFNRGDLSDLKKLFHPDPGA